MTRRNGFTVQARLLLLSLSICAPRADSQTQYSLKPTPKTVAWGYYDAKATPVLHVRSGDTVEIQTLITSSPKRLEDAGVAPGEVEQSLRDITAQVTDKGPGGHILTGPIYVDDAQVGDVLEVFELGDEQIVQGPLGVVRIRGHGMPANCHHSAS